MTTLEWILSAGFVAIIFGLFGIGYALDHIAGKIGEIEAHCQKCCPNDPREE